MKAFLLHRQSDFELEAQLPPGHEALVQDLGLDTLFEAMAAGDRYLLGVSRAVVLAGLRDPDEIIYRQRVLEDCVEHAPLIGQLYELAVAAIEGEQRGWRIYTGDPGVALSGSVRSLEQLSSPLRQLRRLADDQGQTFESDGFNHFFATLRAELNDAYLLELDEHLRLLRFRSGVSINGRLGKRNAGTGFVLLRPSRWSWRRLLPGGERGGHTIAISRGDDAGFQALADLQARGINLVANAVGQAVDHILSFFAMVRFETGFYLACLNLRKRLLEIGESVCLPEPRHAGEDVLTARGVYDVGLSLRMSGRAIGNDVEADGRSLVMITGANQGGKSTFLRCMGIAQVMMQCGLFVGAEQFRADVRDGVFTHFKRREDPTMTSGKLDEELKRFSDIADDLTRNSLLLFNESFAATNEREGADIAEEIVRALLEAGDKVLFVTHSYELARRFLGQGRGDILFLRAERLTDGRRTFRQLEGEPLPTSYGQDLFRRIFASDSSAGGFGLS
jgi:adenosyl cobinamide kinase/adenosyl cobinamide phosphate guanylyltransferase